jgi:pyrroline-5-carboxylate reductase
MARSLALGLGEPALYSDSGSGRAQDLASATGGEAVSVATVFERADVVLLCHKPAQLEAVAAAGREHAGVVVSALAATSLNALRAAYPRARVVRTMPNIPVELGRGVLAVAAQSDHVPELESLLRRLGLVISLPEEQFGIATAIGGCAPAFFALFAQELVGAAVRRGMDAADAERIVMQTLEGTAATLAADGVDTGSLIAAVASPGGLTERALGSFAAAGLGAAVDGAVATVLGE